MSIFGRAFDAAQSAYDNMTPDEDCDWDEVEDSADEPDYDDSDRDYDWEVGQNAYERELERNWP